MAIPLSRVERQLEGVAPAAAPSERLPWPDENSSTHQYRSRGAEGGGDRPGLFNPHSEPASPPEATRTQEHWSATQLQMLFRCPEQWRRRYVLGQKERPGAALIQGGADHRAHEHNFRQKITSEKDLPVGDVTDAFDQAWRDKIDEAGGPSEVEWGSDDPNDLKDQAAKLVALYHHEASPLIQPVAVEEEFFLNLPGVRLPVKGYLDLRVDGAVIDRKTTKKRTTLAMKPDWRLQGRIYAAHSGLPVWFHQSVKTKKPAVYVSDVFVDRLSDHEEMMLAKRISLAERLVHHNLETIGPDQPWPGAETHPWACGYCGYRPTCAWWSS